MSRISDLLKSKVSEYQEAIAASQDNSWDLIKSAAVSQLKDNGVADPESLIDELAKQAGFNEVEAFSFDSDEVLAILTKSASYMSELEVKIQAREEEVSTLKGELEKVAQEGHRDVVDALMQKGFSEEDAQNLLALPAETLNKIASRSEDVEPWEMGKGARQSVSDMDPLLAFLNS